MGQPVIRFEIVGRDAQRLQRYYSELFGWEINSDNPNDYGVIERNANVNAQGVGISGGIGPSQDGGNGYVTVYVEVPDVEAALARAQELGGHRVFGPAEIPGAGMEFGQLTDPDGHLIAVMRPLS